MLMGKLIPNTMDARILMLLRDEGEYVCEECGTIYGLDRLIFVHVDGDNKDYEFDDYDIILKDFFHIELKSPLATYLCPHCRKTIVIPDRRQRHNN